MELYSDAAKAGVFNALTKLQDSLAFGLTSGMGWNRAFQRQWSSTRAPACDDADDVMVIGMLHYYGDGVKRDRAKAAKFYQKTAE